MTELLLLDTHVWLWLLLGTDRIASSANETLRGAVNRDEVYLSAISLFEIAYAVQRGRIELPSSLSVWFDEAFQPPCVRVIPITTTISVASTRLPVGFHGDPADRIIAATALAHDLTLCTHDGAMVRHGRAGGYKFIEV